MAIADELKLIIGYTETTTSKCKTCKFCRIDYSTDNFGPGDHCIRNPDITFRVKENAFCAKWELRTSDGLPTKQD